MTASSLTRGVVGRALTRIDEEHAAAERWGECSDPCKPLVGQGEDDSSNTFTTIDDAESDCSEDEYGYRDSIVAGIHNVRFSPKITTHLVPPLSDFSKRERKQYWYSDAEKAKLAAKRNKIIARIEAGKPEGKGRTYRGLEPSTTEGAARSNHWIDTMIATVMDEQDKQWLAGIYDEQGLANASLEASFLCVAEALENAQKDAQAAIAVHFMLEDNEDDASCFTEEDLASVATEPAPPKLSAQQAREEDKTKNRRKGTRQSISRTKSLPSDMTGLNLKPLKPTKPKRRSTQEKPKRSDPPGRNATGEKKDGKPAKEEKAPRGERLARRGARFLLKRWHSSSYISC